MPLPDSAYTHFTDDLRICRILNGMWQVSGAHGTIDRHAAIDAMLRYHDAGFTTWDLADHYGPAEDFIGTFRQRLARERGAEALNAVQAFTKWVPSPGPMPRSIVENAVHLSLRRMNVETLDLLQFHWWHYRDTSYLEALRHLAALQKDGKIRHLALTNFDTEHIEIISAGGIRVVSNQIQYSILDRRPEVKMAAACQKYKISLLTYGTLCGGLLSEQYINQPEPQRPDLNTASLRKYKTMIDAWGGWALFQELLSVLQHIAQKHQVTIANVATRYILDKPFVAGIIAGARLGLHDHFDENAQSFAFTLDEGDMAQIHAVTDKSRDLYRIIGDCGDEYR
jgi:aryl-alcohol dehydrogenase-like predicted oxidoreductase